MIRHFAARYQNKAHRQSDHHHHHHHQPHGRDSILQKDMPDDEEYDCEPNKTRKLRYLFLSDDQIPRLYDLVVATASIGNFSPYYTFSQCWLFLCFAKCARFAPSGNKRLLHHHQNPLECADDRRLCRGVGGSPRHGRTQRLAPDAASSPGPPESKFQVCARGAVLSCPEPGTVCERKSGPARLTIPCAVPPPHSPLSKLCELGKKTSSSFEIDAPVGSPLAVANTTSGYHVTWKFSLIKNAPVWP